MFNRLCDEIPPSPFYTFIFFAKFLAFEMPPLLQWGGSNGVLMLAKLLLSRRRATNATPANVLYPRLFETPPLHFGASAILANNGESTYRPYF